MAENMDSKRTDKAGAKRRLPPMKTLAMLVGVFAFEAVAIGAMFFVLAPEPANGDDKGSSEVTKSERTAEVLVVEENFVNLLRGRTYLYETEVVIRIRQKYKGMVEEKLKERKAQIRAEIAEIFRAADPTHLHETTLSTIKRQIESRLNDHLGRNKQDKSFVDEVIIPRCTEYRGDI